MTEENYQAPRKPQVAVIREELVALTGHYIRALILNQFLYWLERVGDHDQFIQEELTRDPSLKFEPTHGWVYKTMNDIRDELMIDTSSTTVSRHLEYLIEMGWIDRRNNPKYAWDRTYQYRVNVPQVQLDLMILGCVLTDFPLLEPVVQATIQTLAMENAFSIMQNGSCTVGNRSAKNEEAIPEIITETTSRDQLQDGGASPKSSQNGNGKTRRSDPLFEAAYQYLTGLEYISGETQIGKNQRGFINRITDALREITPEPAPHELSGFKNWYTRPNEKGKRLSPVQSSDTIGTHFIQYRVARQQASSSGLPWPYENPDYESGDPAGEGYGTWNLPATS